MLARSSQEQSVVQLVEPDIHPAFQIFGEEKTGGFKLLLFSNWWWCQTINHHKRCSDLCASKTTDIHAFIQIICNVSILGTIQGPQQKHEKRGKSFKQVVGKKTCNNKSCRATWAVFYILMGFVARYSLRYFNQYETKCISANLLAFLSRISKHYLHGSIIKMCIS